jgi:hypothetical protein
LNTPDPSLNPSTLRYYNEIDYTPISSDSLFHQDEFDGTERGSCSESLKGLSALHVPGATSTVFLTSARSTVSSQELLTIPASASAGFRREDLKIQKQKHFQQTESNSYAVQLQAGETRSKAWDIRMYSTNSSDRGGPKLCVFISLDSGQPYRFPPKPPTNLNPTHQYYCSNATLHARSLMDLAEKRNSYKRYIERTHLDSRDRKVLACALDRIGHGDFAGADIQPWKIFKAACQDWAKSGKWKETKYANSMQRT